MLNEAKLANAARRRFPFIDFRLESFDWSDNMEFAEQMRRIRASDVLIGMHGAGLAHQVFLPPWAAVIEARPLACMPR